MSSWANKLTKRNLYFIAIATVGLMILANQFIIQEMLKERKNDAVVINLAGKQRMLSQKIGVLSYQAVGTPEKIDDLKTVIQEWERVHEGLQKGDSELRLPSNNSTRIASLFSELEPYHSEVVSTIEGINSVEALNAELPQIASNIWAYLPIMDSIVKELQEDSENEMENLILAEVIIASVSLLVLILELLFIFRPIVIELKRKNHNLKKISHSKDRIMATVVHDLRSPLTGITGLNNMLRDELGEKIDDEQEMMFDLIKQSTTKMNGLIQELLEISIIESEDFHLETEIIHVKEYLYQTISQFKAQANEKNVNLDVEVNDEALKVSLDQEKFSRVLDNLITNALKFTDNSGQVKVKSYKKDGRVCIEVKDTGIGIPENLQPLIFNKFSKARRMGLKGEKTTGLGMSIVKQIVDLHQGKIWFNSKENKGTSFTISLPEK
jgi:signal transduction histidine kinase